MPIYLDRALIEGEFPKEIAEAILHIKAATAELAVTPNIALGLMRQHLAPLLPSEHRDVFDKLKTVAWDDLYMIYVELGSRSEDERLLFEIGCAIKAIYAHSTAQPRELAFPDCIEVPYFIDMYDHLRTPIRNICQPDRNGNCSVFRFCKYCWRHAIPARAICPIHSLGGKQQYVSSVAHDNSDQRGAYTYYKEGQRQKILFDKTINKILTAEVTEFHESNFTAQVLFPQVAIKDWLSLRRPNLWNKLGDQQRHFTDATAIDILLGFLHDASNLVHSVQDAYNKTNDLIRARPILIWPMLLRAEAWFVARESSRRSWGGSRKGAGRKQSLP